MSKRKIIRVCNGPWCCRYGSKSIFQKIKQAFGLKLFSKNDIVDLDYCSCLGYCSSGPNVAVDDTIIFFAHEDTILEELAQERDPVKKEPREISLHDDFLQDI